jgi:cytochrome b subunit of formate dehydrogenase
MVDGSILNKGLYLNTYCFTHKDILILKRTLENMFGDNTLKYSIHKYNKGERIYIWE